jgi:hypothetical protein
VVQDLAIHAHVVNFRREGWQDPDGDVITPPLPADIDGHFGMELRRFVGRYPSRKLDASVFTIFSFY